MVNWALLTPRNIFAIAAMGLLALWLYSYFSKKLSNSSEG